MQSLPFGNGSAPMPLDHPSAALVGMTEPARPSRPRFSVIVPTYNRAGRLLALFEELDAQTWADYELIVVDDGSADDTAQVLGARTNARFRWRSQPNAGPWAARNLGATIASGEWLVFLDDDDDVDPRWLQELATLATSDAGLVSCGVVVVDVAGNEVTRLTPGPLGSTFRHARALFLPGAFAVRREVFDATGGYDVGVTFGENYELGIRIVEVCERLGLAINATTAPMVRRVTRDARERASVDPKLLLQGARRMLEKHDALLRRDPCHLANILAIAGVNAARLGDWPSARAYLLRSATLRPFQPARWARVVSAWIPAVGRRIWSA
jgi:glycosyltransferase involved in cell wall biosynthesis